MSPIEVEISQAIAIDGKENIEGGRIYAIDGKELTQVRVRENFLKKAGAYMR